MADGAAWLAYVRLNLDTYMHMIYHFRMRTTLDLPEDVIEAARAALGFKSKTDTVVYALKEVIRKRHVQGLTSLFGKVHIELDLEKVRGRQPAARATSKA